jgi:hypothetical protein
VKIADTGLLQSNGDFDEKYSIAAKNIELSQSKCAEIRSNVLMAIVFAIGLDDATTFIKKKGIRTIAAPRHDSKRENVAHISCDQQLLEAKLQLRKSQTFDFHS